MPTNIDRVLPGDLIRAEHFNEILDCLDELQGRLLVLEGGGTGLAITGRLPSGPYRIGDEIQIQGRGFEYSLGAAHVFFNAVEVVPNTTSSNDFRLVVVVPPLPGVTEAGTPVLLRVQNSTDLVSESIQVRPAQGPVTGNVDVEWLSVNPTTVTPNQPADFRFRIRSRASGSASFLVSPLVQVAANQGLWQSRLEVRDDSLSLISGREIELAPDEESFFHVRIAPVPTGTAGTDFTMTVGAAAGGVTGSSGGQSFQVGTAAPPADGTISLSPSGSIPTTALSGDVLTVTQGVPTQVVFSVGLTVDGTYDVDTQITSGSNWNLTPITNAPTMTRPPTNSSVLSYIVSADSSTSGTGVLTVTLQRQGQASQRQFPLNLLRA